jgi:hypothetical protein
MTNLKLVYMPLLVALLSLGACARSNPNPASAPGSPTACTDPRPQICTADYTPVCAQLKDGQLKTYSNACSACADVGVVAHNPSTCE